MWTRLFGFLGYLSINNEIFPNIIIILLLLFNFLTRKGFLGILNFFFHIMILFVKENLGKYFSLPQSLKILNFNKNIPELNTFYKN